MPAPRAATHQQQLALFNAAFTLADRGNHFARLAAIKAEYVRRHAAKLREISGVAEDVLAGTVATDPQNPGRKRKRVAKCLARDAAEAYQKLETNARELRQLRRDAVVLCDHARRDIETLYVDVHLDRSCLHGVELMISGVPVFAASLLAEVDEHTAAAQAMRERIDIARDVWGDGT